MYAAGARTFVEVGPGYTLTGLVGAILGDRDFTALAVDSSRGQKEGQYDLARCLAQLAAVGYDLDLTKWDPEAAGREEAAAANKPAFTVSVCGANQFAPKPARPRVEPTAPVVRPCDAAPQTAPAPAPQAVRPAVSPAPAAALPRTDQGSLAEALRLTQKNMEAICEFQVRTAEIHQKFLDGQSQAQQNLRDLIERQQRLLGAAGGSSPLPARPAEARPDDLAPTLAPTLVPATPEASTLVPAAGRDRLQETLLGRGLGLDRVSG